MSVLTHPRRMRTTDPTSARQASIRIGVSEHGLLKLVALGRIVPVIEPGSTPKYKVADVERLAAEMGRPAL